MKHLLVGCWWTTRSHEISWEQSFVIAINNNLNRHQTLCSGQVMSGQGGRLLFRRCPINQVLLQLEFLRPSGAVAIAFAAFPLLVGCGQVADDSVPDSASSGIIVSLRRSPHSRSCKMGGTP
jgi:hypothetical protein